MTEIADMGYNRKNAAYDNDNANCIFELEKQLHEQYAVNNNSNAGILISLISALLISFSGYGYLLYQYSIGECNNIAIVNLAAVTVMVVMVLLYCISVYLGASQRMEQFVTIAIRKKYYQNDIEQYKSIFPEGYMPFGKDYCNFVQGVYNFWTKVSLLAIMGIGVCDISINCSTKGNSCIIASIIFVSASCTIICVLYRLYKFRKYKEREKERINNYLGFLPELKNGIKSKKGCVIKQAIDWFIKKYKWIVFMICLLLAILMISFFCIAKQITFQHNSTLDIELAINKPVKIQIMD